ncbi:MAG: DUF883 domain-containing protein [Betaproteobacteria bacterium]|nr:DUF883 domain-containing protein [Betaproteobacteria bacterium]
MNDMNQTSKEKLIADLRVIVADSEELLRSTAGQAGEKISEARAKAQDHLASAKNKLADAEVGILDKVKDAGCVADDYVHDSPWGAIGIAASVGFLFGLLIGRR